VGMVLAFLLAVTIEYRCVKWVWVGDVYNRKVYCIEFQEENGWAVEYEAIDCDEETKEEEIPTFALNAHEPL